MGKAAYKKYLEKACVSANGRPNETASGKETKAFFKEHLPESVRCEENASGLNRKDNRWSRGVTGCKKLLKKLYPDFSTLRERNDENTVFIGFEELFTEVTRGVDPNDPVAVHRRACLITAQCIMIGHFALKWERALHLAVAGMPPVPDNGELYPWHEYVRFKIREFEKVDARLSQKLHRFYRQPTTAKRIHARAIDGHKLRDEVIAILDGSLPQELFDKERQQSFNPCEGSGYPGNLEKTLEYYRAQRQFAGDIELVKVAADAVVRRIKEAAGKPLAPWTHEQAAAWLYFKTDGRTEVGGRFHCKQSALGKTGADEIVRQSKTLTDFTTRLPCEVGNRFVPAKNVHSEKDPLGKIIGRKEKDRTTYAVYKAKQIHDLRYMYALQRVMAGMEWFVALAGHDATFNVNRSENQIAMSLYNALRVRDAWGASWDFSSHDAFFDVCMALLYGQNEFAECGLLPQLFPETSGEEWKWSYECSTQSTRFIEHGILFAGLGKLHGADSGEGWTNGGESLVGAVMLTYSLLKSVERNVPGIHDLIKVDGFVDAVIDSTHMMFMGDDTASVTNHADFVNAINRGLMELGRPLVTLDAVKEPSPSEAAADLSDFGTNPSTDRRKISYFSRADKRRMFDFTAHQCYVEFDDTGEVIQHIHGYYCFLRALASYVYCEARSPQELLVASARHNGEKVRLEGIFNGKVLSFFVALQYSILSNTYMNPGRLMVPVFKAALRHVPHFGGFFAVADDAATVEAFMKNMPIRETLTEQRIRNSRVFMSLLEACSELAEHESRDEVDLLIDWSGDAPEMDVTTYAKQNGYPYADVDWDALLKMYPVDNDPANNQKIQSAHSIIKEQEEDIAANYSGRMYDSIMLNFAKSQPVKERKN